jgi:putative ABC transport system permease protein
LRTALGAGRWRLARQALTEGLVLSLIGGALGFCAAFWVLPILIRWAPGDLPRAGEVGLNWRMMLFALAVTMATPLVFCLGPVTGFFRPSVVNPLRGEGRTTTQSKHQRLIMAGAVVAQFSLACLLLCAAGLITRSLMKAMEANPGFKPEHVISVSIALPTATYKTHIQVTGFFESLLSKLSAVPGVEQTGAMSDLPMSSTSNVIISIEGHGQETERVDTVFCLGNALETLRVVLLQGRTLRPEDQIGKQHSVVISDALAHRIWPQENAIGRRIRFGVEVPNNDEPWLTIVGVVADVKAQLSSDAPRMLLFTTLPDWVSQMSVVVRTSKDPRSLANTIRFEIGRLDRNLPVERIETVDQVLKESLSAERFRTWLMLCFASAALLLATLGIGGLLAYNTARRTQEFGVRVALGAGRQALLLMVLKYCLCLCGTGIATGLLASIFLTRALSSLLYETSPHDLGTFLAVPVILVLLALGACVFPAWRVVHTDPIVALRTE